MSRRKFMIGDEVKANPNKCYLEGIGFKGIIVDFNTAHGYGKRTVYVAEGVHNHVTKWRFISSDLDLVHRPFKNHIKAVNNVL